MAKRDAWRWLKWALSVPAPKQPAFKFVLVVLANHADEWGTCYPGFELLMRETGYSKQTISDAIHYWREKGVINWKRGWGNDHARKSNHYAFDAGQLSRLAAQPEEGQLKAEEGQVSYGEGQPPHEEGQLEGGKKVNQVDSNVLRTSQKENVPVLERSMVGAEGSFSFSRKNEGPKQGNPTQRAEGQISGPANEGQISRPAKASASKGIGASSKGDIGSTQPMPQLRAANPDDEVLKSWVEEQRKQWAATREAGAQ